MSLGEIELPTISDDANKYSRGSLAVIAGSSRYPGAAVLASLAASRSGAGYVTLYTARDALAVTQAHLITVPVVDIEGADAALDSEAIVIGPGLTNTPQTQALLRSVLDRLGGREQNKPLLIDADGLNALAALAVADKPAIVQTASVGVILTPHAGELERLRKAFNVRSANDLARLLGAIVVSKGPMTLVTDGQNEVELNVGSPALATAGTGDVLSGIIGSLLAQAASGQATSLALSQMFDLAVAGVTIHGAAGRAAEARLGRRSVTALDVIDALPAVFKEIDEGA